ncbi:putative membrane protein [Serratia plymuthica A30]|nr:putative membrane protein [Serratia plymuthica A30]
MQTAAGRNVKARVYIAISAILSAASLSVDFGFAVQVAPFRQ